MDKIITIAIPTFNRASALEQNLNYIFDCTREDYSVLVSDNASTDSTYEVCHQFLQNKPEFKYVRNQNNLGYDLNVLNCLNHVNTPYVWFLSDDDFINDEILQKVINYILVEQPDCMLINADVYRDGECIINNLAGCNVDKKIIVNGDTLSQCIKWSSLISSQIIKKELVNISRLERFSGTCFVQLPMFWESVYNKNLALLGSVKIQKNDADTHSFNLSNAQIWVLNWVTVIMSMDERLYTKLQKKSAIGTLYGKGVFNASGVVAHAFMGRLNKTLNLSHYKTAFKFIEMSIVERIGVIGLLLAPHFLLNLVFNRLRNKI